MLKKIKLKESLKTILIILSIYIVFILYLLLVSDRIEKLDEKSPESNYSYSLKIGN